MGCTPTCTLRRPTDYRCTIAIGNEGQLGKTRSELGPVASRRGRVNLSASSIRRTSDHAALQGSMGGPQDYEEGTSMAKQLEHLSRHATHRLPSLRPSLMELITRIRSIVGDRIDSRECGARVTCFGCVRSELAVFDPRQQMITCAANHSICLSDLAVYVRDYAGAVIQPDCTLACFERSCQVSIGAWYPWARGIYRRAVCIGAWYL